MNLDHTTFRLNLDQFINEPQDKDLIVLHHTVGGSAASTFDYWNRQDERRVATPYLVDRDGTIYETFDPACWAYHLGLKGADAAGGRHERRSIGIELASEGALLEHRGNLYCFDVVSGRTLKRQGEAVKLPAPWRGRQWFDAYEPAQLEAATQLVEMLLQRFPSIPRRTVRDHSLGPNWPGTNEGLLADRLSFRGVLGHADLRADKTDPHPLFPWSELARRCALEVVS